MSRHIGHRCVLDFSQGARSSIGPVVFGFDKFAERLIRHAALNIGKIIGIRLALFECDIARKHAVRIMIDHGRVDLNAASVYHIGHATGHDGVACRRGGGVAGSVLLSGCHIARFIGGISRSRLLRFSDGLCRRSSISCRRGRRSRILRNCRCHRNRGNLTSRSGGIRTLGRKRQTRQ